VWKKSDMHRKGAKGFRDNMLSLALDGSEDGEGSQECRDLWRELGMDKERQLALFDVQDQWDAGALPLTFASYQSLLEPFPKRGVLDECVEGQEDEGMTVDDERDMGASLWDDDSRGPSPLRNGLAHEDSRRAGGRPSDSAQIGDRDALRQIHLYEQDLTRLERMSQDALECQDLKVRRAIEKARRDVTQKASGKGAEDARIADAMLRIREQDDDERAARRLAATRRKEETKAIQDQVAAMHAEKERLLEQRVRLRLDAEAQEREQEAMDASRSYDTSDFTPAIGQRTGAAKNRWIAMQRVLLLSRSLPPESVKSLARDWLKWDNCNLADDIHFPSANSYGVQYRKWIRMLLSWIQEGKQDGVRRWWLRECELKVPRADVVLPALPCDLLASAKYLTGPSAPVISASKPPVLAGGAAPCHSASASSGAADVAK
jgi:hypothetical protein